jgi:hypothetical protein
VEYLRHGLVVVAQRSIVAGDGRTIWGAVSGRLKEMAGTESQRDGDEPQLRTKLTDMG